MDNIDNSKIDIGIWKNFYELIKSQKNQFLLLFVVMITVGFIDAIYPLFSKYAIDNFISKNTIKGLDKFILVFFLVFLFQAFNAFVFILLAGKKQNVL